MKKNISIDNGNAYHSAKELTEQQVIDVYDQVDVSLLSDATRMAAEDASADLDGIEAKRAYIAKIADLDGEICLG